MKAPGFCFVLFLFPLAGCNHSGMTVNSFDGSTGETARTTYSKYYDAGAWIVPNHLGMSVVIDHEKRVVPIVYGAKKFMGALGPDDSSAQGKVTIYLGNFDQQPQTVKILRVTSKGETLIPKEPAIIALPLTRSGGPIGTIPIFHYGTRIPILVEYEFRGRRKQVALDLPRRTQEELSTYFGAPGNLPYPWKRWPGQ